MCIRDRIDKTGQAESLTGIRPCCAEHQEAGHAQRIAGHVTAKTDEGPLEPRWFRSLSALIERIEHDARALVMRRHLEEVAAAHPPERDAVVEEDGCLLYTSDAADERSSV